MLCILMSQYISTLVVSSEREQKVQTDGPDGQRYIIYELVVNLLCSRVRTQTQRARARGRLRPLSIACGPESLLILLQSTTRLGSSSGTLRQWHTSRRDRRLPHLHPSDDGILNYKKKKKKKHLQTLPLSYSFMPVCILCRPLTPSPQPVEDYPFNFEIGRYC